MTKPSEFVSNMWPYTSHLPLSLSLLPCVTMAGEHGMALRFLSSYREALGLLKSNQVGVMVSSGYCSIMYERHKDGDTRKTLGSSSHDLVPSPATEKHKQDKKQGWGR